MSETSSSHPDAEQTPPRREFLTGTLAVLCGAVAGGCPSAIALYSAADPLVRKHEKGTGDGFLKITSVDGLPTDGTPRMFKVVDNLTDAWNKFPDTEVGAVFLHREPDGTVVAYNARCPHLGCTVGYDAAESNYVCPCHASAFDLTGKPANDIPPRPLDQLSAKEEGGMIWVKFQNFRAGTEEQKPL